MGYAHYNVDDTPLSLLIDTSASGVIYIGEALPGSNVSELLWRIKKIDTTVSGTISGLWAGGSPTFQFAWANRSTYNYS